jgi:hypothetical protein
MGDYLARFREHVYVVCAGEWKPPPQKRSGSSHGSVTIDSIYYYGKSLYQDVNLRSYFSSIRPPTKLAFGFRLGRCIILHFPKRTFIHFFLPGRSPRLKRKQDKKSRPVLTGKGLVADIWQSRADRVSSFKRGYRGRTKRSERPGGREKSRVDRPGEAKRNPDLAEKDATLWIP